MTCWRVPKPPGANPLVAERAFRASDGEGLTRVPEAQGKLQESVGISHRLLTPATPTTLRRLPRAPFNYFGGHTERVRHSPDFFSKNC